METLGEGEACRGDDAPRPFQARSVECHGADVRLFVARSCGCVHLMGCTERPVVRDVRDWSAWT